MSKESLQSLATGYENHGYSQYSEEAHLFGAIIVPALWVRLYTYRSSKPDTHAQRATLCVSIA